MILNHIENDIYCSTSNAILKAVKMNFGSKFGTWVIFHTAILQSWKFQENRGWTVVSLGEVKLGYSNSLHCKFEGQLTKG